MEPATKVEWIESKTADCIISAIIGLQEQLLNMEENGKGCGSVSILQSYSINMARLKQLTHVPPTSRKQPRQNSLMTARHNIQTSGGCSCGRLGSDHCIRIFRCSRLSSVTAGQSCMLFSLMCHPMVIISWIRYTQSSLSKLSMMRLSRPISRTESFREAYLKSVVGFTMNTRLQQAAA